MQFYQSKLLKQFGNISHAFTTNSGGVSKEPYNSLNLAFHVEDNKMDVEVNHKLLAKELNYNKDSLVHMKQIHSNIVHIVNDNDSFSTPPTCDALITDKLDTPLMVMVADCSPILFFDDEKKVIAVAHAGRAGAFKNIVKNVVDCFKREFNSDETNIYVSVGASIGSCCYEVGSEINDEAKELNLDYSIQKINNSYYLDVSKILKTQLIDCGVKEENIELSNECSCCDERYFSYRREGTTGRFSGIIGIVNNSVSIR